MPEKKNPGEDFCPAWVSPLRRALSPPHVSMPVTFALHHLFSQRLAGFEQGLKAGDDRRPAASHLRCRQRSILDFVDDGELAVVALLLDHIADLGQLVAQSGI